MWRVLQKEVRGRIFEALELLVDLALVFQEHSCGRLERMSNAQGSRLSVYANLGRRRDVALELRLSRDKSTGASGSHSAEVLPPRPQLQTFLRNTDDIASPPSTPKISASPEYSTWRTESIEMRTKRWSFPHPRRLQSPQPSKRCT